MAQPWHVVERVSTKDGILELRRRGERDYLITVGGQVLMNSSAHRSELALGALACRNLRRRAGARVLVGGLGMGFTLRAVLDSLPATGQVVVAELNPVVVQWCRGPLAELTGRAIDDPRVTVEIADVHSVIQRNLAAQTRFHTIVLDLYEGPSAGSRRRDEPLYGLGAVEMARAALEPGGVFAVWGENHDPSFEKRLRSADFSVIRERPGFGGLRHVVYVATARPPYVGGGGAQRRPKGRRPAVGKG